MVKGKATNEQTSHLFLVWSISSSQPLNPIDGSLHVIQHVQSSMLSWNGLDLIQFQIIYIFQTQLSLLTCVSTEI